MNQTTTETQTARVMTPGELLNHWQGHRRLTRRMIEAFPEKEFFTFSIGGMRTCAELMQELVSIAGPGIREIVTRVTESQDHHPDFQNSKSRVLELWDEGTQMIDHYWPQIPATRFSDHHLSFGMYPGTVQSAILYFIDNEIHHRAQAYVYLRALGIEPPAFYER